MSEEDVRRTREVQERAAREAQERAEREREIKKSQDDDWDPRRPENRQDDRDDD